MKVRYNDLKPGDIFQVESPLKAGTYNSFLKLANQQCVNMDTYVKVHDSWFRFEEVEKLNKKLTLTDK